MSENKFIKHLKGEETAKSVLEIKNQSTPTSFANMPHGTSDPNVKYSDHRGNATVVAKGTDNWKLDNSTLVLATDVYGDGRDVTSTYTASGNTTWVNAVYTFSADKMFTAGTKWVLKLCGHSLLSDASDVIDFSLIIKFNNQYIITKTFSVKESAFDFCKEFVVDFSESEQNAIKMANADTMTVQLLCADATASATIYNGMTVLTALQRRVDGDSVASDTATFNDLETRVDNIETELSGTFVKIDGTSIMTAPLKFMSGSVRGAVGPYFNGVGFWKLDSQGNLTQIASISDSQFIPTTTSAIDIGNSTKKWKDLYLGGKAYMATINNGYDISVPTYAGTMLVADSTGATAGQYLALDSDLKPVWANVVKTLPDLSDVEITSASNGQVLTYDGSKWVNQAAQTPTINFSINGGNFVAGSGTYALSRFCLMLQKPDGTWEKPTDTSVTYSEATDKTVNTNGFLLNQIMYYNNTGATSGGQVTGINKVYSKHPNVPMSYSTNCGTAPGWTLGTYFYLVGTLGADGLFYLDTTTWWATALPNTADGKLYIRLGAVSSSTSSTVALLEDRPIFYHDGTEIKEYHPVDKNIANWSSNVTNCITYIPQDIKLELNNGTLTLKAGSKVYVPNGSGVFDEVVIANDISSNSFAGSIARFVFIDINNNTINAASAVFSGQTSPTLSGVGFWYDTVNNIIRRTTDGGATWTTGYSFPICIVTSVSDVATSIDQVFNGFGYIGKTVFALPGVKGLIPNGRNADGTLNNTIAICNNVTTGTWLNYDERLLLIVKDDFTLERTKHYYVQKSAPASTDSTARWYNPDENLMYKKGGVGDYNWVVDNSMCAATYIVGSSLENGEITYFSPKRVFRAVDYNDTEYIAHQAMPSDKYVDLTLGASGATYRAPADGFLYFAKSATAVGQYFVLYNGNMQVVNKSATSGGYIGGYIPASKRDSLKVEYTLAGNTVAFRFIYANGAK